MIPHDDSRGPERSRDAIGRLTVRQREDLRLLAEENTKKTAAILNLSPGTAAFHEYRIMEELKISSDAGFLFAVPVRDPVRGRALSWLRPMRPQLRRFLAAWSMEPFRESPRPWVARLPACSNLAPVRTLPRGKRRPDRTDLRARNLVVYAHELSGPSLARRQR